MALSLALLLQFRDVKGLLKFFQQKCHNPRLLYAGNFPKRMSLNDTDDLFMNI